MRSLPEAEFKARLERARDKVRERGLDAMLVHSNEADFANVRYFSDYWPIFESAGVLIPVEGKAILLIGPESETFARDHSVIPDIRKILWYRETAEPDYPDIDIDSFDGIFAQANNGRGIKKLGIAGWPVMPISIFEAVRAALPGAEIVNAGDIMHELRIIKSDAEIEMLRQAFKICSKAAEAVIGGIKPGMTELQAVGIAQAAMYMNGAEYEAHPTYVLSGVNSSHAIGRPSHKVMEKGEMVQLNIGARVGGYSPSIGFPICLGKMSPEMKDLVAFGLEAHHKTMEWMKAGIIAGEVARRFFEYVKSRGYGENLLYGPCHGLGMLEVERPWMETTSTYPLQRNMTFQVDTFLYRPAYGLRWESGVRIIEDGVEQFAEGFRDIYEIA